MTPSVSGANRASPAAGRLAGALLTLFVAGCATAPEPTAIEAVRPEPVVPAEEPAPEIAAVPVTPPPIPAPDMATFMTRPGIEIEQILGGPSFVRRDPPAELWQYRASDCTLDLFFYDDGFGNYRLVHFGFRGDVFTRAAEDDCLRDIIELTRS